MYDLAPTDFKMLNLQYVELIFNAYEKYYIYSAVLVTITLASGVWAVKAQYEKRMNLYNTVQQKRVMPIVFAGTVRYTSAAVQYGLSVVCLPTSWLGLQRKLLVIHPLADCTTTILSRCGITRSHKNTQPCGCASATFCLHCLHFSEPAQVNSICDVTALSTGQSPPAVWSQATW